MKIGNKIYYDAITGVVILNKGQMQGDVRETTFNEDKNNYSELDNYSLDDLDIIQLQYDERRDELSNMGSMRVINGELIIYPKLTVESDKYEIVADGLDTATITVTIQDTINTHSISFVVNDGNQVVVNTMGGVATLQFDTTLVGDYLVKTSSDVYGVGSISIKGV